MEKKRILIVEDEDPLRKMLALELEAAGHQVDQAENGEVALGYIKKVLPDLIITDVLMPIMDGFAFYKELKKSIVTSTIPVLVLTARGKMEDSFRVMGVDDFISKPFEPDLLYSKINDLLNRSKPASDLPQNQNMPKGKRVLVSGSDNETIENMVVQLKKANCHTDLVTTGAQIISKVVMFLPEVLIIEVLMEDIEASEVIRIIRQMPQGEKIPILGYSYYRLSDLGSEDARQRALSVDSAVENCNEIGMTEYLGRFNENTFMKVVAKYLK